MSKPEKRLWETMRDRMKGIWDEATRHEDKYQSGIADVSFAINSEHGWMELKVIKEPPVRPTTPVRVEHFTAEQRGWLHSKGAAAGNTWMFLRVGRQYFLIPWYALDRVGEATLEELAQLAIGTWKNVVNWEELGVMLSNGCSRLRL